MAVTAADTADSPGCSKLLADRHTEMGCGMLHVLHPVERRARQRVEYVSRIPARDANTADLANLRIARCET